MSANFDSQFVISDKYRKLPFDSENIELNSVCLSYYGNVKFVKILDDEKRDIGLFIGYPVDILKGPIDKCYFVSGVTYEEMVENIYNRLSGSWILLIDVGNFNRIYLDACGTKSLVFDKSRELAAATALLIFSDETEYSNLLNYELIDSFDVRNNGWLPGGLTAHSGVERLMPNHYLDLKTFTQHRHWPTGNIQITNDVEGELTSIVQRIGYFIDSVSDDQETNIGLTAGNDSRFLLSCSKHLVEKLKFFTVCSPEAGLDEFCAEKLASSFQLNYFKLPFIRASPDAIEAWIRRAGHCVGGPGSVGHPSIKPLRGCIIDGSAGEVGRGFLWLDAQPNTSIDASNLIDRLKLPRSPLLVEQFNEWLSNLPEIDSLLLLDLAYIELRMSSWAYVNSYTNPDLIAQYPFVSRANFVSMLSLPHHMRRSGTAFTRAIELQWPELLSFPINRYGDARDILVPFSRIIKDPNRIFYKARQLKRKIKYF